MSKQLLNFSHGRVVLPYDVQALIKAWSELREVMIRKLSDAFSRDEWAYLITFLDEESLWKTFETTFGTPCEKADVKDPHLYYPRGTVAVWLPNNVSLLGPLTLILLSLTGNKIRLKGGSRSEDLCAALIDFVYTTDGSDLLRNYLKNYVEHAIFDQSDPRNAAMAAKANARIIFGSNEAATAINTLPHPVHSISFPFTERRSEAWIDIDAVTDAALESLIKVFLVYGQAGCTSPARVVLLNANDAQVHTIRNQILTLWPRVTKQAPEAHVASSNTMAQQWAAGVGWTAILSPNREAVIGTGKGAPIEAPLFLPIQGLSTEEAFVSLPENIQTIGYALAKLPEDDFFIRLTQKGVKRFVPLAHMHHFGSTWDGYEFWSQMFESMEVES